MTTRAQRPAPEGGGGDPSPEHLSEEIRALVRNLSARLRVESAQVTDLSVPQQAVLARLASEPNCTSADLARLEFVRPQSMNTTVAALREQGLVSSVSSPDDGRRKVLVLTDAGRDELQRIRTSRNDWLSEQLGSRLSASERRALARSVEMLRTIAATPTEVARSDADASVRDGAPDATVGS